MNLGALIANWRHDCRDTGSPPLHETENLARWFGEAEEEGAIRKSLLRLSIEISIYPGDTEITLPDGVYEVRTARIVEGGEIFHLWPTDRYEQDRMFRDWRDTAGRPTAYIHDDTSLTFNRTVETESILKLETYRVPRGMADLEDFPEISPVHHRNLAGWVLYRAFSVPDTDFMDPAKAAQGLADFTDYFGQRPDADHRRNNNANRPHRVKAWP